MTNWLDNLVAQHSAMESPRSFWLWAGLVTISAVVKDNVWISRGGAYNCYPNIYCIFHAKSGLKKGPPINLAKKLVAEVNSTKVISGRSSIQGILKKLGTAQSLPGGHVPKGSHGFICSSELSASIVGDPAALDILTDLYDRNYNADDWDSLLKMEEFSLKNPTISLLGGINPAHSDRFFEKKDISGGFIARTFIIHETEENTINSLARRLTNPPNKIELSLYLKQLAKLHGPFKEFSDENNELTEVGQYYDNWYNEFRLTIKKNNIEDETGTLNRFGDSVIKVAMLLSLAKRPVLEIDIDSLKESIEICEKFVSGIRRATFGKSGAQVDNNAVRKAVAINELMGRDNHSISREQLNKKYWTYGNVDEWDACMHSLEVAGFVKIENKGTVVVYTVPDEQYRKVKEYLEGKSK